MLKRGVPGDRCSGRIHRVAPPTPTTATHCNGPERMTLANNFVDRARFAGLDNGGPAAAQRSEAPGAAALGRTPPTPSTTGSSSESDAMPVLRWQTQQRRNTGAAKMAAGTKWSGSAADLPATATARLLEACSNKMRAVSETTSRPPTIARTARPTPPNRSRRQSRNMYGRNNGYERGSHHWIYRPPARCYFGIEIMRGTIANESSQTAAPMHVCEVAQRVPVGVQESTPVVWKGP